MSCPSFQVIWQDVKREIGNKSSWNATFSEMKRLERRLNEGTLTPRESIDEAQQLQGLAYDTAVELEHEGYPRLADFVEERADKYHPDQYDPEFAL